VLQKEYLFLVMLKILVTGANGFVGYYLTKLLIDKNMKVLATGKGECRLPFQSGNFSYRAMDFTNREEVKEVFVQFNPRVVVHCGALSKPDDCELNREAAFLVNVNGTIHLLNASAAHKAFFIFLSTDFVFSGEKGMYQEEDERNPVNYYGETKLMAEDEVMQYKNEWAIVRTVLVYGKPFLSRQNILTNTAIALKKGEPLKIFCDQVRTPTYVEDLTRAIVSIIEKKATGIYHVSGEDVMTPYDMAVSVANHLGLNERLISAVEEKDFDQPARRPLKTGFDISKAKRNLGYQPIRFEQGLQHTFN
jgi:dTDP-4-dehydrorhamnose reductase